MGEFDRSRYQNRKAMKKIMFNDKYGLTKAVLEGRKTQTRRIVKSPRKFRGQDINGYYVYRNADGVIVGVCMKDHDDFPIDEGQIVPKYKVGEIVAVAQSYHTIYDEFGLETMDMLVSELKYSNGWSNKMFVKSKLMPHQIRITKVRIQRLQEISDEDCLAEGIRKGVCGSKDTHFMEAYYLPIPYQPYITPKCAYAELIDKVSGEGTWQNNPYVFVYDFELIK